MVEVLLIALAVSNPNGDSEAVAEAARMARSAVAEKLALAEEQVSVDTIEAVDWPDSGLGCPVKGEVTQPVITPGYRLSLRVGDETHEVHVGAGHARICSGGTSPPANFLAAGVRVAALARKDLAVRLGLEPREVRLLSMKPITWPDRSLGCPSPDGSREPVPTKGFVLTLKARDKEYTYHADTERSVACPKD